ncbi:hypothetical protein NDU88_009810 [Pleurodeles waltl]|uniref:Uncharacterized protein n=1 Tax=Pleurodeles waltl TaxID=8319 RepID=A0AAV7RYN8_PLEWA|nr:hypothetical protein NDU88_009810 [Pleurodeles waltl]
MPHCSHDYVALSKGLNPRGRPALSRWTARLDSGRRSRARVSLPGAESCKENENGRRQWGKGEGAGKERRTAELLRHGLPMSVVPARARKRGKGRWRGRQLEGCSPPPRLARTPERKVDAKQILKKKKNVIGNFNRRR